MILHSINHDVTRAEASLARLATDFLDKLFGLSASNPLTFAPDYTMNPVAINHYVNAEHSVAVSNALENDAVFSQASPRAKRSHDWTCEFFECSRH